MNRLVIIGAGGHCKVVADIALKNGYADIILADDNAVGQCMNLPIVCKVDEIERLNDGSTDFVIAIGNNNTRERIAKEHPLNWVSLVHPSAQIGFGVEIEAGTVIMAGAIVNSCAKIGAHSIINTGAIIEHDCIIDKFVHISPNAVLGGTVFIGEKTHIALGAAVKNNTNVCEDCIVGMGAIVVKDIIEPGTYIGVPARKVKDVI